MRDSEASACAIVRLARPSGSFEPLRRAALIRRGWKCFAISSAASVLPSRAAIKTSSVGPTESTISCVFLPSCDDYRCSHQNPCVCLTKTASIAIPPS